jgi:uncharacterized protein YodC (DUF2158 family)
MSVVGGFVCDVMNNNGPKMSVEIANSKTQGKNECKGWDGLAREREMRRRMPRTVYETEAADEQTHDAAYLPAL